MDKLTQLENALKAKQVPFTQGELQVVINFIGDIKAELKPKDTPPDIKKKK